MRRALDACPLLLVAMATTACLAHGRESVAGPDTRIIATGSYPREAVEIHEDPWGIPHVRAANLADAMFALGVLHAEERLWQMDLNRRVGHGRLSELFGKRTIGADRYLRTLQMTRAAEGALAELTAEERTALDAYVAGVNEVIGTLRERPPEYRLLRVDPEPWTPVDSLVWMKVMSLSLSGSAASELLEADLIAKLGPERARWFSSGYPADAPRILPPESRDPSAPGADERELPTPAEEAPATPAVAPAPPPGDPSVAPATAGIHAADRALALALLHGDTNLASNNWVLAPSRTATDAPLLANDPHLGVSIPSIWYLAEIDTPEYHAIGTTFPGTPGIIIGHNEDIAWGITTGGLDPQDLYYERIRGHEIAVGDTWVPLERRRERIAVRRGKAVELEVRVGPRGPIMSEFHEGLEQDVSLRWISHDPDERTMRAFLEVGRAHDWEGFRAALADFDAPAHNFVYADRRGHIGWKVAGKVPIRGPRSGKTPGRGWEEEDGWRGYVPHDELPEALDPARGYLASANNKPVPDDWPIDLGYDADESYRAQRIHELLDARADWDVAAVAHMQLDVHSAQARELLPFLRRLHSSDPALRGGLARLQAWDGAIEAGSPAAALYEVWLHQVVELIARPHLGDELFARWRGANGAFLRLVLVDGTAASLCEVDGIDGCEAAALEALRRALEILASRRGAEAEAWTWGELHALHFHHPLGVTRGLRRRLDVSVPASGDSYTVSVASYGGPDDFTQTWLPSYRQVIDLGDWSRSRWIYAPGQSGAHYREHYRDLVEPYMAGDTLPMLFGEEARARARRVRVFRRAASPSTSDAP